ncbi:MAG: helix-turn-helix domain-containing protein [Proteobacteria bacterium]|nr:helix-turn-helix domain-containing protein [Pseudomonadota bacterium]
MMEPVLCSISEAARSLGIGKTKTYELISDQQLECVTIGTRRLVKVASIKRLVEAAAAPKAA